MDIKSINTTGWRKPHKEPRLQEITENEEELDSLREAIYYEDSKVERNLENIPNTIEWLTTWRKMVS